jgi:hypothetical protein
MVIYFTFILDIATIGSHLLVQLIVGIYSFKQINITYNGFATIYFLSPIGIIEYYKSSILYIACEEYKRP